MSLNDNKRSFYISQGIAPATVNDMELEWLQDNGATANSLMDSWKQFLELQGYPYGTYNDSLFAYLEGLGYTGALNDMLNSFYAGAAPQSSAFTSEFTSEYS